MSKKRTLVISIAIPLLVGGIAALLTSNEMGQFNAVNKPPLSPPGWLFPIVWTILYILMGIASFAVYTSKKDAETKDTALLVYGIQLFFNFWWSIIFFNARWYLVAAVWLFILWLLIILNVILFGRISKYARNLLIPYLVWVTFALYLNIGIWILN
ncbi:MAG: tryptophan-rich sensory protein [Lachnospiraceae bacterium]|nr:tryptophan-rich sensory protein [Lachnospiraceae bacterium]